MSIRVLLAGGGTSGHVHPALAIADRIRAVDPESVIEFCGTSRGIESDLVPKAGYTFHVIRARGIPSRPSRKLFLALADMAAGRRACLRRIRDFRPDIVIGTGGYVCTPLVSAAHAMRIPVLLHEQNAFPGRSNRMMSRNAAVVCTGFPDTESFFSHAGKVVYTGNPVKEIFFQMNRAQARRDLGLADDVFLVLAMGGSLGARTINDAVSALADAKLPENTKIVLSAGRQQHAELIGKHPNTSGKLEILEYIYNPEVYMAACDLMICRAGAITCAEIAALGIPSIMIPYPFAAGDHQTSNAASFANQNASVMMKDNQVTAASLADVVATLYADRSRLSAMGDAARRLACPDAAADIVREVMQVCENRRKPKT